MTLFISEWLRRVKPAGTEDGLFAKEYFLLCANNSGSSSLLHSDRSSTGETSITGNTTPWIHIRSVQWSSSPLLKLLLTLDYSRAHREWPQFKPTRTIIVKSKLSRFMPRYKIGMYAQ